MTQTENRADGREQPLELILARNLVSIVSVPALLVDVEGRIAFYNDAARLIAAGNGIDGALDYDAVKRLLARWDPHAGVVYFQLLLDDQLGNGFGPEDLVAHSAVQE